MANIGIDRYYYRNTLGISLPEALWGFGLPALTESTFLQLFLKNLGASDWTIGLVPGILSAGVALFALLAALLTSHLARKRRAVIITHVTASLPVMIYGLILVVTGRTAGAVPLFLTFYLLFALGIGITLPVWQNFIVCIFPESRLFRALSVMLITQIFCRLLGSLAIARFVGRNSLAPEGVGAYFIGVGLLLFAGSFFFLLVKEDPGESPAPRRAHDLRSMAGTAREILRNRNYMFFQLSNIDIFACVTVITFYANYAVRFHGIESAVAAGLFLALLQAGAIASNILMGWFNLLDIRGKYIAAKLFGLAGVSLLLFGAGRAPFFAASVLLGMARGVQSVAYSPAVKMLSGRSDATDYFCVTPLLMLPFSFGIPFAGGFFLDAYAGLGAASYRALFLAMGALILAGTAFILLTRIGGVNRSDMAPLGTEIAPLE